MDTPGAHVLQKQAKMSDAPQQEADPDEEANFQKARKIQDQLDAEFAAEEEASFALAIKLSFGDLEGDDAAVTQPHLPTPVATMQPACAVCTDVYNEDRMVRVSGCGHPVCRPCMRQYVGGQVRAAGLRGRGIIYCPVCQEDDPNRGG